MADWMTLETFLVRSKKFAKMEGVWQTPVQMQSLAFTSAHGKVLKALIKS